VSWYQKGKTNLD